MTWPFFDSFYSRVWTKEARALTRYREGFKRDLHAKWKGGADDEYNDYNFGLWWSIPH